ncbi:uncharacterized protein LOC134280066 isoform X3 [Saccostrea cucullata]|uniref:uncharacterized protein LOC134280066 isoform X3 n=1 Tax=Saccostrea cuccullata TaxID=36930 RepID=UPI002ED03DEC
MNFNFIILLLGISFSYIAMEQSAVIRDVPLNWTEARNECRETNSHLLNFFEMKNRLDYFKSALIQNTKYWVAETWKEKIYFVKGCQSKIQGLSMVIDQGNIFSECVKYCENQNYTTIGLQGSTCSCIVKENFENLESNSCDIECAWNNISCRAEKCSFAIYQLAKDVPQRLPGDLFDDCVYYNTIIKFSRDDCNKKYHFICQDMKSFLCSFIQKYNSIGLLTYSREDCSINTPYLCLEGKERSIYVLHEIFYLHLLLQSVK